jgi:hypothetical protein
VAAAARSLAERLGPTVAAVAGPMVGAAGAVVGAGRRIAGVRGEKRGCIGCGVELGCRIGSSGVGVAVVRTAAAGRIRGGEEGVGTRWMVGCCRMVAGTCRAPASSWAGIAESRGVKPQGCTHGGLRQTMWMGSRVLRIVVVGQTSSVQCYRRRQESLMVPWTCAP